MSCKPHKKRRGFTLVEAIFVVVVISVALVGVLLVFQNTVRASADPQIYKQSLAIAEAMLDEILAQPYDSAAPGAGVRANFTRVDDYHLYSSAGVVDMQGNPVPGLGSYNVAVTVVPAVLNDTPATLAAVNEAKRITVTVTHPLPAPGVTISIDGYRLRYTPP